MTKKMFNEIYPIFNRFRLDQIEKEKKKYLGREVRVKDTMFCGHVLGKDKGEENNLYGIIIGYQTNPNACIPIIRTQFGIVHVDWNQIDHTQEIRNRKLKQLGI